MMSRGTDPIDFDEAERELAQYWFRRMCVVIGMPVWFSKGLKLYPHEMSTDHLRNAIAFAERNNIQGDIVKHMKSEFAHRMEIEGNKA